MTTTYPEVITDLHIARHNYEVTLACLTSAIAEAEMTEDYQSKLPEIKKLADELHEIGNALEIGLKTWFDQHPPKKG